MRTPNTITPTDTIQQVKQKLFNNGYLGLANQGEWSYGSQGCAYRGFDNCKCVIGFSILDEHYNNGLEGMSASSASVKESLKKSGYDLPDHDFLKRMQNACHDNPRRELADFTLEPARQFAKENGLTIPEIKESQS